MQEHAVPSFVLTFILIFWHLGVLPLILSLPQFLASTVIPSYSDAVLRALVGHVWPQPRMIIHIHLSQALVFIISVSPLTVVLRNYQCHLYLHPARKRVCLPMLYPPRSPTLISVIDKVTRNGVGMSASLTIRVQPASLVS